MNANGKITQEALDIVFDTKKLLDIEPSSTVSMSQLMTKKELANFDGRAIVEAIVDFMEGAIPNLDEFDVEIEVIDSKTEDITDEDVINMEEMLGLPLGSVEEYMKKNFDMYVVDFTFKVNLKEEFIVSCSPVEE